MVIPLQFLERDPPDALRDTVTSMWFVRGPAPSAYERILPSSDVHLIVPLTREPYRVLDGSSWRPLLGAFASGLRDRVVVIANPGEVANTGAAIRADALHAFGIDPAEVAGAVVTVPHFTRLAQLLGTLEPPDALATLSADLSGRRDPAWRPDVAVRATIERIRENPTGRLGDFAVEAGLTPSGLVARFRQSMGVTPKLYAEIVRLEGLLDRFIDTIMKVGADGGPRESWGALAADAGYYDQSHLTRAFHRFVGMTPGAFAARVGEGGPESVRFLPEGEDWDRRPRPSTRDGPSG